MTVPRRHAALSEEAAREMIARNLDTTLFVEAGAGSGKTSSLIARIVEIIRTGACDLDGIAAITFTEASSMELKLRLRGALGAEMALMESDESASRRLQDALDHLDEAMITTIHGFCQRLLAEHPIEAGLPPRIEVLDEVRQGLFWRAEWSSLLDRLGDDEAMRGLFGAAATIGITPAHPHLLAREAAEAWDRCAETEVDAPSILLDIARLVEEGCGAVASGLEQALAMQGYCLDPSDRLLARLGELDGLSRVLSSPGAPGHQGGWDRRLAALASSRQSLKASRLGQKGAWACDIALVRSCLKAAEDAQAQAMSAVTDLVLRALLAIFDGAARRWARSRQEAGTLVFHDLIVLARDLLRQDPEVLARVRRRIRYLLIDEFQDTDPLQLEIAAMIGADGSYGQSAHLEEGSRPAREGHGRLFFVGDPKQSIYHFRGADLAAYELARDRFAENGPIALTSNFRSVPGICDFINECLAPLLGGAYSPLRAVRARGGKEPPVRLLGGALDGSFRRSEQRMIESDACAAAIDRAVRVEGWLVGDGADRRPARMSDVAILVPRRTGLEELEAALDSAGIGYRVESASLVFRSQQVRDLLALCRVLGDPSDTVALLAVLRSPAFACRDDELYEFVAGGGQWSLDLAPRRVTGDDDAAEGVEAATSGDGCTGAISGTVVREALATLARYRSRRFELGPVAVLEEAIRDRRLLQLAAGSPGARECWRRVRFLVERARAFVAGGGGGLLEFADWVEEQLSEGLRVVESILPEPDEDVVHILTVHAAKGLEFPITVLAGFGTTGVARRAGGRKVMRTSSGGSEVYLRADLQTSGYGLLKESETALEEAEELRLLYVAATRARDYLIVCAHHLAPSAPVASTGADAGSRRGSVGGQLVSEATRALQRHPDLWMQWDPAGRPDPSGRPDRGAQLPTWPEDELAGSAQPERGHAGQGDPVAPPSVENWNSWRSERAELLNQIGRRQSVRATEVAQLAGLRWSAHLSLSDGELPSSAVEIGDGTDAPDRGQPRGKGGTQLGRAVHGTLQRIGRETARRIGLGLAAGTELSEIAAAQARVEHIATRAVEVEALVAAALRSPTVKAAFAGERLRREIYVAAPVGGKVLDGYVDLCFEDGDGLTVVDYKTDAVRDLVEVEESSERYSLQAAAYALALHDATGLPIRRCVLVFLAPPGRPVEFEVPDLAAVIERVRAVVGAAL